MNFSARGEGDDQFQIAPLLDIVFILLIFFVVTYAVSNEERVLGVNLPESKSAEPEKRSLRELVVNLNPEGAIVVNRQPLTPADLEARLRKLAAFAESPGVIIRADGDCPHKHVVEVMDICARTKVRRVFFSAVTPPETPARP